MARSNNNNKLKAFVRFDGTGRIIPSSLIVQAFKPAVGNYVEIDAKECCNPSPGPELPLRMLFSNILEVEGIVGDVTDVANWNTLFDLPTYGTPFTSVSVTGDEVKLYGGSNIIIKEFLFDQPDELGTYLLEVDDTAGSVIELEGTAFGRDNYTGCPNLTSVNLPNVIIAAGNSFGECLSLTTVNLPNLTTAGEGCFGACPLLTIISLPNLTTLGAFFLSESPNLTTISLPACTDLGGTVINNNVFYNIIGNSITLTVPSSLMTCNGGLPDGDIQYLQTNNTVTVVTV